MHLPPPNDFQAIQENIGQEHCYSQFQSELFLVLLVGLIKLPLEDVWITKPFSRFMCWWYSPIVSISLEQIQKEVIYVQLNQYCRSLIYYSVPLIHTIPIESVLFPWWPPFFLAGLGKKLKLSISPLLIPASNCKGRKHFQEKRM